MNGRWRSWFAGLIRAAIGAGANALSALVVSPDQFNFQHPQKLIEMAGAGALIAVVHYLQQSPLPPGVGESGTVVPAQSGK